MANTNVVFGLKPVRAAGSAPYNDGVALFHAASTYATALFIGDTVVRSGTADATGVPGIIAHTPGSAITGVVVGFQDAPSMQLGYGAASTARYVLVRTDPNTLYEVQEDAVGGALAAADVSLNANLINGGGSTTTRRSGIQLDTSTKATTATLDVRIMGFAQRPDNEIGANAKVLVMINNSTEVPGTASAGI